VSTPALAAAEAAGLAHRVIRHGPVRSLAEAARARGVAPADVVKTGYERGTITPLGSVRRWPVIADERMRGREITLGAGEHGLALAVDADEILLALNASVADISDPESAT
jgi:Cys-tRNA(Pro)/Cys-tRNA(Cys) deacylase